MFNTELETIIRKLQQNFRVFDQHTSTNGKQFTSKSDREQILLNFGPSNALYSKVMLEQPRQGRRVVICVNGQKPEGIDSEHFDLDIDHPTANQLFTHQMQNFVPNWNRKDSYVFSRGLESENILGKIDYVHNVVVDMRKNYGGIMDYENSSSIEGEFLNCTLQTRKCLNLSAQFLGPTSVVLCVLWDGPAARELLDNCRFKFRRVFYLVQTVSASSTELLLLKNPRKGSLKGFDALESEEYLGCPAFLVCRYPDHTLMEITDRRVTKAHPTGRENAHLHPLHRPKWLHQTKVTGKIPSERRPRSFISSHPTAGDVDGGIERTRVRHFKSYRYDTLSHTVTKIIHSRGRRPF